MPDYYPKSTELLTAVTEFLRNTVAPQVDRHTSFHCKVAANALEIVKREIEQGSAADEEDRERLNALLNLRDANEPLTNLHQQLARQIRHGERPLSDPDLIAHLRASTLNKILIDNPHYTTAIKWLSDKKQGSLND